MGPPCTSGRRGQERLRVSGVRAASHPQTWKPNQSKQAKWLVSNSSPATRLARRPLQEHRQRKVQAHTSHKNEGQESLRAHEGVLISHPAPALHKVQIPNRQECWQIWGLQSFWGTPGGWTGASVGRALADGAASPQHRAPTGSSKCCDCLHGQMLKQRSRGSRCPKSPDGQ